MNHAIITAGVVWFCFVEAGVTLMRACESCIARFSMVSEDVVH